MPMRTWHVGDTVQHLGRMPAIYFAVRSVFLLSRPIDLLKHGSDATNAAKFIAGVSGIPALHHLPVLSASTFGSRTTYSRISLLK